MSFAHTQKYIRVQIMKALSSHVSPNYTKCPGNTKINNKYLMEEDKEESPDKDDRPFMASIEK